MLRKSMVYMLTLAMLFLAGGCSERGQEPSQEVPEEKPPVEEPVEERDIIKDKIEAMSLEEKIGQLVVVGIEGTTIDETAAGFITEGNVGGVILFGRNVENTTQLLKLINSLKEANADKTPLFIAVDEEGGRVSRLPSEFTKLPTAKRVGDRGREEAAYSIGGAIAGALKAFGYNMDFAPVLDINSNPKNPVIGDRAFGIEAEAVSEMGIATMRGLADQGVIAVVKHFPGHGDTAVDSHISLPVVNKTLEELRQLELIPFKKAIEEGVDTVMVAHIQYNKIDPDAPATLSSKILTDLLRKEMGFEGVIITDDLTMGAIIENHDIGEAAITAINAGSDIVLSCHGYENSQMVLEALKNAVAENRISTEGLEESVYRILKLKDKYKLNNDSIDKVDIDKINSEIKAAMDKLK